MCWLNNRSFTLMCPPPDAVDGCAPLLPVQAAAIVEEFEILKAEWREEAQKWGQDLFKGNQEQYQKGFKDGQRVGTSKNGQTHKRERDNGVKEEKVLPPKRDKH